MAAPRPPDAPAGRASSPARLRFQPGEPRAGKSARRAHALAVRDVWPGGECRGLAPRRLRARRRRRSPFWGRKWRAPAALGGLWRARGQAHAPGVWDSACGPRPMVPSGVRGGWPRPSTHARATPAPGGHRSDPRGPTRAVSAGYDLDWDSTRPQALRPTPASVFLVFHSGSGMRKIVFQVIQYKPFQILVESLWEKCLPQASLFSISGSERVSRYQDLNGSTNSCFCV